MILSSAHLPEDAELVTDVCVVGAGPAGICIARSLAERGVGTIVLESGGPSPDAGGERFQMRMLGRDYPAAVTRLQGVGGSSGHWTGVCRPLEPDDFTSRSWIPHSGWPIAYEDLAPWYEQAQPVVELGPFEYGPRAWGDAAGTAPPALGEILQPQVFQYSPPTRFAERYRAELERNAQVQVVTHATATRVQMAPEGDRCEGVRFGAPGGRQQMVRARHVVLAAGAIETARLLLASRDVRPAGVGNGNDLVGRFFMEHPVVWNVPFISLRDPDAMAFFSVHDRGLRRPDGTPCRWRGHLALPADERERAGVLAAYVAVSLPTLKGLGTMSAEADPDALPAPAALTLGLGGTVPRARGADGLAEHVGHLTLVLEQAPNRDSRVVLDGPEGPDGLPPAALDWRLTALDRASLTSTLGSVASALGVAGLGRVRIDVGEDLLDAAGIASHHMGTARMAASPRAGVVDAHGRVHETTNVWVAGSASFPTVGSANPTLTVVALSLRLADHLAGMVAS